MGAPMNASCLLVLGGARSGKSRYAQDRAEALEGDLIFIATAHALDEEMAERIARHRSDRGKRWRTIESPLALADTIAGHCGPDRVLLVDCLTLWMSNLILGDHDVEAAVDGVRKAISQATGPLIFVSNEVGLGIVPDNALARRFRDAAGSVNRAIAAVATEAMFIAAGLPLRLK
jgi:adenosylcobinamide kinase/adenosylcobinamide-phosphate guanylyltransferase